MNEQKNNCEGAPEPIDKLPVETVMGLIELGNFYIDGKNIENIQWFCGPCETYWHASEGCKCFFCEGPPTDYADIVEMVDAHSSSGESDMIILGVDDFSDE